MSEFQIGLLVIGAVVVAAVLAYNRLQERSARRGAERAFRSGHDDVLLAGGAPKAGRAVDGSRPAARAEAAGFSPQPHPGIDYIVELAFEHPAGTALEEQWKAIERRHAPRALLGGSPDRKSWRAGLQLVSRDGVVGEADLIEFRSGVESLAASNGARASAPEMRVALEAARELDQFCAEADIQVVVHIVATAGTVFAGSRLQSTAQAAGLALEADGKFSMRDAEGQLLYCLGARDGAPFSAASLPEATTQALTLALELGRAPETGRSFEATSRFARQLAAALGGNLVDDNGNALDERALAAIAQQLDAVRAKLEARGVPPGSPAALRLFS